MLFSIVVPIFNVRNYLSRCVKSLVEQTYNDIEILLIDDGSTDGCSILCDQFVQSDSRIRVIHKMNGGLSDARNCGIREARGKYIMFVDSDDYIEIDACEKLSQHADGEFDVLVGDASIVGLRCGKMIHDEKMVGLSLSGQEYLKKSLKSNLCPMAAWLNVCKRSFLLENGLFFKYGIFHEDEQLSPYIFLLAKNVMYTGVNFYNYYIRENSITTTKDWRKNAMDLYETLVELESVYIKLDDIELKNLLLDSLAVKYLSLFYVGKLYRYKKLFIHKDFLKRVVTQRKTKMKVFLFRFSPQLYCFVNRISKILSRN